MVVRPNGWFSGRPSQRKRQHGRKGKRNKRRFSQPKEKGLGKTKTQDGKGEGLRSRGYIRFFLMDVAFFFFGATLSFPSVGRFQV